MPRRYLAGSLSSARAGAAVRQANPETVATPAACKKRRRLTGLMRASPERSKRSIDAGEILCTLGRSIHGPSRQEKGCGFHTQDPWSQANELPTPCLCLGRLFLG